MAETPKKPAPEGTPAPEGEKKKSPKMKKLLMFGIPVVVVQLVLAYFLIGRVTGTASAEKTEEAGVEETTEAPKHGEKGAAVDSNFVFIVKDIIVNPAGTNGLRFLLTTIGLEVTSPEVLADLEKKEVQVRDALITILSSKTLGEIDRVNERDSLRVEISHKISPFVKDGTLRNVYFSKFIIQ